MLKSKLCYNAMRIVALFNLTALYYVVKETVTLGRYQTPDNMRHLYITLSIASLMLIALYVHFEKRESKQNKTSI